MLSTRRVFGNNLEDKIWFKIPKYFSSRTNFCQYKAYLSQPTMLQITNLDYILVKVTM